MVHCLGVVSASFATIISQFTSAILCFIRLLPTTESYRVSIPKIKINGFMLKQIISNGLPAGFQNSIIAFGTAQARTVTLFDFLLSFSHCIASILRGGGKSAVPMFIMMLYWCIIRVSYITIIVKYIPVINAIFWAYPLTWFLSSIIFLIYLLKVDWIHAYTKKA